MPSGKGEIMSTTFGVRFKYATLGPAAKLSLPAPKKNGNINVDVIVNINHITIRSIDRSIDLRSYGECEYTDYNGRRVTIKHHDIDTWHELEISITIED